MITRANIPHQILLNLAHNSLTISLRESLLSILISLLFNSNILFSKDTRFLYHEKKSFNKNYNEKVITKVTAKGNKKRITKGNKIKVTLKRPYY